MAASKIVIYLFAVLVPLALVYCQDSSEGPPSNSGGPPSNSGGPPAQHHDGDHDHHERFFFSLIPRLTSCNYSTEAGRTCRDCNTALTCLSSGVGLVRRCSGLFRYCNEGRCSLFQGSACSATTTSSTSSSSSTSTSTSSTSTTTQASG